MARRPEATELLYEHLQQSQEYELLTGPGAAVALNALCTRCGTKSSLAAQVNAVTSPV